MTLPFSKTSKRIAVRVPPKKFWIPAVIGLIAIMAFIVWQLIPQRSAAGRSIAVMGFKNQTGDPAFDYLQETIPNLLITSLEQSGHFRMTTWQRLQDLLRQAGRDQTAVLDEEAGFEVCRREGIEALVVGSYTKAGDTFVTDVKVLDAATKQPLKTAQARGDGAASILKTQVDEISRSVSRGVGRPALKIEKSPPKVADLTTSSLEAYSYFLRGRDELERFFPADARKSQEKAVELDPEFAVAWLYLSDACNELADRKAADAALAKAKQFSAKTTEKDRLRIEAHYAWRIEQNPEKRFRLLRELTERYPAEKYAHFDLGFYYENSRLYSEAAAEYERALALDPNFGYAMNEIAYVLVKMGDLNRGLSYLERYASINPRDPIPIDSIAEVYMRMGKLDESAAKFRELLSTRPDFYPSWAGLAYVCALQEDYGEVNRCLEELIARAPSLSAKTEGTWLRAYYRYLEGRWDQSQADYSALRTQADRAGATYVAAMTNWVSGFIHTDRQEYDLARQAFGAFSVWNSIVSSDNPSFIPVAQNFLRGWVDFKQGRLAPARTALKEIEPLLGRAGLGAKETMTFLYGLLTAEVALAENSTDEAIGAAEQLPARILPTLRTADVASYNQPFLKDVLARAYWKKGDLERAAAEYGKLTTIDPANQVRYLIHPLYHYRLGRVLEEKGDKEQARAEYGKFLECWKDADPTHPELADARKRLAAPGN